MFKRLAVLAAIAVTAFACVGMAAADAPVPLDPSAASALAGTTGTFGVWPTVDASPSAALAAASLPGAMTDHESDLTLAQAVGLDPLSIHCWANAYWGRWGTWPYEQKLTDTTYWCARYGVKITYRTTTVTTDGTLCGTNWRDTALIGGGVGYPNFTMRSSAQFSCPTIIPWITLHPTHHIDVRRNDIGGSNLVGSG